MDLTKNKPTCVVGEPQDLTSRALVVRHDSLSGGLKDDYLLGTGYTDL